MKKATTIIFIYLLVLGGCKKETDIVTPTPPLPNPFATNEALIDTAADVYLIADVEGLNGVAHINEQTTNHYVTANWSSGHCYTGNCSYGGGIGSCNTATNWMFNAYYYGTGESRQNLIVEQYTKLITSEKHGVELIYRSTNGNTYTTTLCNNASLSWANIGIAKREAYTGTGGLITPTYYLTLKFNCELANKANANQKIQFKNAVLRIKL